MAESHEPSYYEIALTNRQVIVAFVILLVCLMTAFFSGVWIGREGTSRALQDQLVRNVPPPQPKAPDEGRSLDELEFFDARKKDAEKSAAAQPPAPPVAPRSGSDTTLLEDFAGSDDESGAQTPAPAAARETPADDAPAPASTAAERRERRKQRQLEKEREREAQKAQATAKAARTAETAEAPAKAPARTASKPAAEPAVPKGAVVIQVFSSADKAQAESIRSKLSGGGQKAYLSPIERGGRTMYRVRLGPFKSRDEAQKVADTVRKKHKLDTWVTE